MAKIAVVHIDNPGGFDPGARTYKLSPAVVLDGVAHDYVTIWIHPALPFQQAELYVVPATESGACALRTLKRAPGSQVLHGNPDSPEYVDGVHWLALQALGGYDIGTEE